MKLLRDIFDDRLTAAAGIVFVLIIMLTIFNTYSNMPQKYPPLGMFVFSMVPVLFITGGVIFVLAIVKSQSAGK